MSTPCGESNRSIESPHRRVGDSLPGQFPERPNGTDCKSVVGRLRGFESLTAHRLLVLSICPCGAEVAHSLGKTGVMGSIPITGSRGF